MDCVVTVPARMWRAWIDEGDLPGHEAEYESHFWLPKPLPRIEPGERVYVVAHGAIRGYAPLVRTEARCVLAPSRGCLVREGGAVAVTVPGLEVVGFRGFRYRWWERETEVPFLRWKDPLARVTRASIDAQPGLFAL